MEINDSIIKNLSTNCERSILKSLYFKNDYLCQTFKFFYINFLAKKIKTKY